MIFSEITYLMFLHQSLSFIFLFFLNSTYFGICSFICDSSYLLRFSLIMSPFISISTSFTTNLIMKTLNLLCMLSGQIVLLLTMSEQKIDLLETYISMLIRINKYKDLSNLIVITTFDLEHAAPFAKILDALVPNHLLAL